MNLHVSEKKLYLCGRNTLYTYFLLHKTNMKSVVLGELCYQFDAQTKTAVIIYGTKDQESLCIPAEVTYLDTTYRVVAIGDEAFLEFSMLETISIPKNVTHICETAFIGCDKLMFVFYDGTIEEWKQIDFNKNQTFAEVSWIECSDGEFNLGTHYSDDMKILLKWNERVAHCVVPDGVTTIADLAFAGTEIESIVIPNSVTHIGKEAFDFCPNLKSVVLPDTLTTIEEGVFSQCYALKSIRIPSSVRMIKDEVFWGAGIESIDIPDSVTYMGAGVFENCYELQSVRLSNNLSSIEKYAFFGCDALQEITIPTSVMKIEEDAFRGCSKDIKVYYDGTVEQFDKIALYYAEDDVLLFDCIEFIQCTDGDKCFHEIFGFRDDRLILSEDKKTLLHVPQKVLYDSYFSVNNRFYNLIIPYGVKDFAEDAFDDFEYDDMFDAIYIPRTVEDVWGIFANSPKFDRVVVQEGHPFYDSREDCGSLIETATNTLEYGGFGVTQIPLSVTHIGYAAFDDTFCSIDSRGTVSLHNNIKTIGERAFYWARMEGDILEIPEGVVSIGSNAFVGNYFRSVILPTTLTELGHVAFSLENELLEHITVAEGNPRYDSRENCDAVIETATNTLVLGTQNTVIPTSVTHIGDGAFDDPNEEESLYYEEDVLYINYKGTIEEWKKVVVDDDCWSRGINFVIRCTDGDVEIE